jgi:quercetin dioxygenase-like cupin family protein
MHTLQDLPAREVMPGFQGKLIHSANMTFVFWEIDEGSLLPEHHHPHEQVATVFEGQFEMTIDGRTEVLHPGTVTVIPSNARHSGRALTKCRILDVFAPVREDYR